MVHSDFAPGEARESEAAAAGARAQALEEARLLAEARAMVAGERTLTPSTEHLRVLLRRLEPAPAPGGLGEPPF